MRFRLMVEILGERANPSGMIPEVDPDPILPPPGPGWEINPGGDPTFGSGGNPTLPPGIILVPPAAGGDPTLDPGAGGGEDPGAGAGGFFIW